MLLNNSNEAVVHIKSPGTALYLLASTYLPNRLFTQVLRALPPPTFGLPLPSYCRMKLELALSANEEGIPDIVEGIIAALAGNLQSEISVQLGGGVDWGKKTSIDVSKVLTRSVVPISMICSDHVHVSTEL
jgi:hypothetical protein